MDNNEVKLLGRVGKIDIEYKESGSVITTLSLGVKNRKSECDRPCMHLICRVMPNGKVFYANKKLRRQYPELKKGTGWASIKDYGFIYNWMKKKYELVNGSIVRYHDGTIRRWQGAKEFTYKDIINSSKYGD